MGKILSFIDCEESFVSADRTALVKVLSLYLKPYRYIKVTNVLYKNDIYVVEIENGDSTHFRPSSFVWHGKDWNPSVANYLVLGGG